MAFLKDIIEKPLTGEWGTDGDEVNVLRTTNFTNLGVLDFSNVVKRGISEKKVKQKKLLKGDIIIEKSGGSPKQPVGRVVFFNEEGVYLCNNFTSILRPKKEKVEPKYLHYLLYASHRFGVTGMFQNKTTGIINLQLPRYVNKLEIPLPPLKTQQHIAQILDDASALRDKTEKLLKEYDLLAQSIFLEMMNNLETEKVALAKIAKINPKKSEISQIPKDTLVTFLPMASVSEKGDLDRSLSRPIKEVWSGFTYFSEDDVLFAKITPCMENGKGCVATGMKNNIGFGTTEFHVLRPIKNLTNSDWIYHLLKTKRFRKIAEANMRGSAGHRRVPIDFFDRFKIKIPPIELQNQFAEKIALIEQQKALAKQELKESKDLFNSLLQKAFKGELV